MKNQNSAVAIPAGRYSALVLLWASSLILCLGVEASSSIIALNADTTSLAPLALSVSVNR